VKSDADAISEECDALKVMLIEKSKAYGSSWRDPVRVFSHADPVEQLRVRIDDKLSRLMRGSAAGEDVVLDLLGYLVLLRIATKGTREIPPDAELVRGPELEKALNDLEGVPAMMSEQWTAVLKMPEGWNDPRQEPRETDGREPEMTDDMQDDMQDGSRVIGYVPRENGAGFDGPYTQEFARLEPKTTG